MARRLVALAALSLAAGTAGRAQAACEIQPDDRAWLERSLVRWQEAERDWLDLEPAPLPTIVAIDSHCTYTLPHGDFAAIEAAPHAADRVQIGDNDLPLGPLSFADGAARFVMSLPSVWRPAGVTSEVGLERLMEGVLLHEIAHTRQAALIDAALAGLENASGLGDDLSDDTIQDRFAGDPAYVAAIEAETEALFAASAAPDDASAREKARAALVLMRERRARWFVGENGWMADADDVFLTMEGVGQWLIYRDFSAPAPAGAGLSREAAISAVRRKRQFWSQDEGLALLLVLDRLLPDWKARAFRDPDWRAERMLAAAVGDE